MRRPFQFQALDLSQRNNSDVIFGVFHYSCKVLFIILGLLVRMESWKVRGGRTGLGPDMSLVKNIAQFPNSGWEWATGKGKWEEDAVIPVKSSVNLQLCF